MCLFFILISLNILPGHLIHLPEAGAHVAGADAAASGGDQAAQHQAAGWTLYHILYRDDKRWAVRTSEVRSKLVVFDFEFWLSDEELMERHDQKWIYL